MAEFSLPRITKVLATAGAFIVFGCHGPGGDVKAPVVDGKLWVHQGEAQGTTYTIKYLAQDSVPQQAIDDELERVDVENV